jgi:hypothetical protein
MAIAMRSTDFRSIVEPVLNTAFNGVYEQRKDEWKAVFDQEDGTPRSYHEEPVLYGFGAAPELPDGNPVTYQSGGQLFVARCYYKVYGLAFALTKVLVEDGDHIRLGTTFSKHLAQSMIETKETLTANVLNRSFNSSYTGGDGVCLVNSAHPINGSTFSNVLSTAANLSHTSLEQMLVQIANAVDNSGKKIRLSAKKLIINPANMFQAEVILNSVQKSGTTNNDINAIKSMGLVSGGVAQITRTTSTTAWWIQTDAQRGLKLLMRRPLVKAMEGDFETDSAKYKATERYGVFWVDPRTVFGTAGV